MNTLPLFDSVPEPRAIRPESPSIPRKAKRDRAHANADPVVLERYEAILRTVAVGPFVAADVTAAYESRYGKLAESDAKGLGGLYGDLQRRGVIVKTGEWRPRKNGNASLVYRLRKV